MTADKAGVAMAFFSKYWRHILWNIKNGRLPFKKYSPLKVDIRFTNKHEIEDYDVNIKIKISEWKRTQ